MAVRPLMPDPLVVPRLRAVRGAVARSTTWWGTAFVRSVEETAYDEADLLAGRSLARSGRLGAIMVLSSMASVVVEPAAGGARFMAQVKVEPLSDWPAFVHESSRETGFVAALEAGQLPADLVEHADEAGAELLPAASDLVTACECDAWTQPCPHALALLYQLAWQIDRDPYVLILLRGRTREWLLEGVEARQDTAPEWSEESSRERQDAMGRALRILALAEDAPPGHGLADSALAGYDEEVSRLLPATDPVVEGRLTSRHPPASHT